MDAFWDRIVEVHRDARRAYPRVQVTLAVSVDAGNEVIQSETHDIGRGGFQLRCDKETAARIVPEQESAKVERRARLTLAMHDAEQPIEIRCRIAHMSLIDTSAGADSASQRVAMGFSFSDVGKRERKALERFLFAHLEPVNV